MNHERMKNEPGLVCTCNDLYRESIEIEAAEGCEDSEEIMYAHATFFRCGECKPIIDKIITDVA
ncbi:MAG: (2Fe-2S)-binding protein [Pseudomonadales bacterium]|nr:(2Fe-2S)-binding protein [Pseudomonadales bacterium]